MCILWYKSITWTITDVCRIYTPSSCTFCVYCYHDDVIKWKYFLRYWPFVRGIHRSPVNSSHKGQWRGAFMFSLICARLNGWVNNCEAGDLRRICSHYDVTVMLSGIQKYEIKSISRITKSDGLYPTLYFVHSVSWFEDTIYLCVLGQYRFVCSGNISSLTWHKFPYYIIDTMFPGG